MKNATLRLSNFLTSRICNALKYSNVNKGHCAPTGPEVSYKKEK